MNRIVEQRVALTTFDNPYDPFDEFTSWWLFDVEKGYNSCAYLDRIAKTTDILTDAEEAEEIERAIDEIVRLDFYESIRQSQAYK